jgi:hypothetical protein
MVPWILMLFSIFYCTAGKLKQCRNLLGQFNLSLDCDGSEVVNCTSAGFGRAHLAPVCTSVLIAHQNQVCTGLFPCCAHLILQFL